jgi:adenylate cyclase
MKRRRVFTSAAAYVVLAALIIELSGFIFEAFLLPGWASRLVTILFVLGFPVVIVLAWVFDVSAAGVRRTPAEAPEPAKGGDRPASGMAAAFRRSHAAPVPELALHRRGRSATDPPAGDGPSGVTQDGPPDPDRLRAATVGHVRHELRTPINGIIGYSEMLLEDVEAPDLREDLQRIHAAGRQLLDRVDALLQPDRVSTSDLEDLEAFGRQVGVDLRNPVNAVVGYAEMLIERCDEAGRTHLLPDLERILAAARRLLAASEDIVGLAAMARGGPEAAVLSGTAMTGQVLAKIRPVSPTQGSPVVEGAGRLLVVDDNETNRDLISRQLARYGYTVATACDGEEALQRLDRQEFDLVLLDVIMPVLDGVETLRRIQASERHRDTPVIMLSSLGETDSAVRCIEMGASDYLSKPVQPTLLEARIAAALEIRELGRREVAYRKRIAADHDLLERLIHGSFPPPLVDRIRAGALEVEESWCPAAVLRCRFPDELRPGAGPAAVERIQEVRRLLARFEEVARTHGLEAVIGRPDGFLAVVAADASENDNGRRDAAAGAARLALDTAAAWQGVAARFAVHVGDVVGGVIGVDRPRFEIWGEAVETVEALVGQSPPRSIYVTPVTNGLLGERFATEARGVIDVAGTGAIRVHALIDEVTASPAADLSPTS